MIGPDVDGDALARHHPVTHPLMRTQPGTLDWRDMNLLYARGAFSVILYLRVCARVYEVP